jgi:acetyl-CoA carboxylase beta subunit
MTNLEFLPHFIALVAAFGMYLYLHMRSLGTHHHDKMPTKCPRCGEVEHRDFVAYVDKDCCEDSRVFDCGARASIRALVDCSAFQRPNHADHRA